MGTKEIVTAGDGATFPAAGDTVTVHYTATLQNGGTKFDSSHDRGAPFSTEIGVGKVIKGIDEGVMQMSQGEKAKLMVTSDCAFGAAGAGEGTVPPDADVQFEVELIKVERNAAAGDAAAAQPAGH